MQSAQTARGTRLLRRDDGQALVLPEAVVSVVGADREVPIRGTVFRVGSAPDNELVLDDEHVSAHHAEILVSERGYELRDLGSTNGTSVGGLRVVRVWLGSEHTISLGGTRLRFVVREGEVEIPVSRRTNFGGLLGHGPAMRAAFAILERAAKTDTTVLVLGESGTGKELAARALHDRGPRRDGPFLVFDCGATAPTLLESHLFGHVRGAFTGADAARAGCFEAADGGTLVLDELGELPLELQPKLLRVLETRTVQRLGENTARPFDVRFVATTNRNLEEEVRAGRFREDLFYRLSVICVRLPPLRERTEEIPRLVHHFLAKLGAEREVPEQTMQMLRSHRWPGNVRELRNAVERFVALPDLDPELWLPRRPEGDAAPPAEAGHRPEVELPFHEAKQRWTDHFERTYLERLLATHGSNVSKAARVAGLSRQSCYRLMKKHGLSTD